VHCGIAVYLARRRLQDLDPQSLRKTEQVDRAVDAGLGGLNWIELIVHWRRRTRKIVDLVGLHVERECHVVPQDLEHRVMEQVRDVPTGAGVETVHADDFAAVGQQPLAQVRTEKSRPPRSPGPASHRTRALALLESDPAKSSLSALGHEA